MTKNVTIRKLIGHCLSLNLLKFFRRCWKQMNFHYLPLFKGNTSNEHVAGFVCIFHLIVWIILQPIPSSNVWEKITVWIQINILWTVTIDYLHKFPLFRTIKDNSDPAGFCRHNQETKGKEKSWLFETVSGFCLLLCQQLFLCTFPGKI